jgi:hypothetical protein
MMHLQKSFTPEDEDLAIVLERILSNCVQNIQMLRNANREKLQDEKLLECCKAISGEQILISQ